MKKSFLLAFLLVGFGASMSAQIVHNVIVTEAPAGLSATLDGISLVPTSIGVNQWEIPLPYSISAGSFAAAFVEPVGDPDNGSFYDSIEYFSPTSTIYAYTDFTARGAVQPQGVLVTYSPIDAGPVHLYFNDFGDVGSAIPEPAAYNILCGSLMFGFAIIRRRPREGITPAH